MQHVTEQRIRSIDVRLGSGRRTLRVSHVAGDADTEPFVVLATGFGGGDTFTRPHWHDGPPIRLPASALPELGAALEALGVDP